MEQLLTNGGDVRRSCQPGPLWANAFSVKSLISLQSVSNDIHSYLGQGVIEFKDIKKQTATERLRWVGTYMCGPLAPVRESF